VGHRYRRPDVRGGVASLIWGILLLLWPLVGAVVLAWWLGAYSLVFGVALLLLAYRLRQQRDLGRTGMVSHA
jgi:uncharacterized membrane protein HdeD (DUF308 family)